MLIDLRNITSLNNLYSKSQGQVATFLILMMVAVLILILVTVNLGNISIQATNLSNAADSSALSLGSQLATKSNTLYQSLGSPPTPPGIPPQKCKKGGLAALVGAIVGALVAPYLAPALVGAMGAAAVGAVGGAIGGAIGGAYAGTGVLQGAIQGAGIGGAIGYAMSSAAQIGAVQVNPNTGVVFGSGTTPLVLADGTMTVTVLSEYAGLTAAGGGALVAGSTLYNAAVAERMTSAAFSAAAKALSGLPEYDQYREGVFLQALSQAIDDPNTTVDTSDFDGDGDTREKVPYFQSWWNDRINRLKGILPDLKLRTQDFINGPLTNLWNFTQEQYARSCSTDEKGNEFCTSGLFARQEVDGYDGALAEVARGLESAGYEITFFSPGAPPADNPDCEQCGPEQYYDSLYALSDNLKGFLKIVGDLKGEDINQLTSTYHSWIRWFYDPDPDTEWTPGNESVNADWYDVFKNSIEPQLGFWSSELETKRQRLPQCSYGYDENGNYYVANPPCKDGAGGSVDSDPTDDEFKETRDGIDNFITHIRNFRRAVSAYYASMNVPYEQVLIGYGGLNPVTYLWEDSRGAHSVTAEAGPFKIARIEVRKSGNWLKNKICLVLVDYSDNGSGCSIKVNRKDPADKLVKPGNFALGLGRWNPYDNDDPLDPLDSATDGKFSISRISRVRYSYDKVEIAGKEQ